MNKIAPLIHDNYMANNKKDNVLLLILGGAITGFANGFFGGGGGMIVVPFLIYVLKCQPKSAHATAVATILPITLFSAVYYLLSTDVSLERTLAVGVGVVLGGLLGAYLLPKMQNKVIMIIFASLMIFAGVKMLV
ncbi:MAG: TSUP family transporter [Clostridia bacterium]|nr:TSUP family transporter [Clostridia bacterium]